MKKSIFITLLVGILSFAMFYTVFPQYSEDDITFTNGNLIEVDFFSLGRHSDAHYCQLDNGIRFFVPEDYIGNQLETYIGKSATVGYVDKTSRSAYRAVYVSVDDEVLLTVGDVNANNLPVYFVVPLMFMGLPGIMVVLKTVEFVRKRKEEKRRLAKRLAKKEKKEKQREKRLGSN